MSLLQPNERFADAYNLTSREDGAPARGKVQNGDTGAGPGGGELAAGGELGTGVASGGSSLAREGGSDSVSPAKANAPVHDEEDTAFAAFARAFGGTYGPDYDPAFDDDHLDAFPDDASTFGAGAGATVGEGQTSPGLSPRESDGMSAVQRDTESGITEHPGLVGRAVGVLRQVYDPEIPVNIYDLGLVYEVREEQPGKILVLMTLTSPMCPVAGTLPPEIKLRLEADAEINEAAVDIVWDPPWDPSKMSEGARLQLNFF